MNFEEARSWMVESQLMARGIKAPLVLNALRQVPRHAFVPQALADRAYDDRPLAIGEGQTISQPYIVGLMTEILNLQKNDVVYEVGTGSGYQSAVLAQLVKKVHSVERFSELALKAGRLLKKLGYHNVHIAVGDGLAVLKCPKGFFDAIILTAAVPHEMTELYPYLKLGGRMVAPVGERSHQALILTVKEKDGLTTTEVCQCAFVPLVSPHAFRE